MPSSSYDYIVVGAGTSGCVIAARLSWKGSVLLLEKGPSDTIDPRIRRIIERPENVLNAIGDCKISPEYESELQDGLGRRPMRIHRGVVRGGCSSVNGMIYVRGNRRNYDLWAQLGNEGWSYEEILPYFLRSENFSGGPSRYHGINGPLDVRPLPQPSLAALAFIDSAGRLGFPCSGQSWDFNGVQQENAAGLYQTNITPWPRRRFPFRRASAAFAFLDHVANPRNLTFLVDAQVSQIIIRSGRAAGVECLQAGNSRTYQAEREVVISAGAFESPKLLMLSGIGPADQLRSFGIHLAVDLPGVGKNLQDHLQILLYHRARLFAGRSDFTAEAGLFTHTRDGSGAAPPDLQFHVLAGMPGLALNPVKHPNFLICPVLCAAQSRGFVGLRSKNPQDRPIVQPNYLQCGSDTDVLLRGIALARDLVHTGELGRLFDPATQPFGLPDYSKPKDTLPLPTDASMWPDFVKRTAITVWHPVGTCKMGRDFLAVVNPQLQVYGVDGLRVADASIMPVAPSGNTNAACTMIGEVCAQLVP